MITKVYEKMDVWAEDMENIKIVSKKEAEQKIAQRANRFRHTGYPW